MNATQCCWLVAALQSPTGTAKDWHCICLGTQLSKSSSITLELLAQHVCSHVRCSCLLNVSYMSLQVVRCFEDADVHHVNGKVDPAEDAETINFELALADVAQIEKRLERLKKGRAKTKEEQASNEVSVQSQICIHVTTFKPICMYQYRPRDVTCLQFCVHVCMHMHTCIGIRTSLVVCTPSAPAHGQNCHAQAWPLSLCAVNISCTQVSICSSKRASCLHCLCECCVLDRNVCVRYPASACFMHIYPRLG